MIPILTPEEMGEVDAAAPEPVEVLIARAGAAVVASALDLLGGSYGRRVVVLAGKGNNGADGRAAAAGLRRRGVRVTVVDALDAVVRLPAADLVIDAAYGTGFHGVYEAPDVGTVPVLAVDIPSGVAGRTGEVHGRPLPAVRTVTFAALKAGLLFDPGRSLAGEVVLADIGLSVGPGSVGLVERDDVAAWLPIRPTQSHKWRAAVLVVAGSPGMTGAARLCARAAQRGGAGMVRLASPGIDDDRARPTEAVGVVLPATEWGETALEAAERCHCVIVGPGLGATAETEAGVAALLAVDRPLVVDGDGLSVLGREARARLMDRTAVTVLTPHDGEFERLSGARPSADRIQSAHSLAADTGAVVLLKGSPTVVADPRGEVRVIAAGDARLATAGTGDVLSGVIGALLAQGMPAVDAAAAGAWLHGRAAEFGPARGLVAGDLPDLLPLALGEVSG